MTKKTDRGILVVKIGTAVLTDVKGSLDNAAIGNIAAQAARIKRDGIRVALVSSGAIVVGMRLLGLRKRPEFLPEVQACAAVGQAQLIKIYDEYFRKQGVTTAQVLLTQDDMNDRARYLNARNTLLCLLKKNIIPIINENDTVSTEEIKFGDNDRLSSLVANLIGADKLIIMSDVEGLYRCDKKDMTKREVISRVEKITDEIESLAHEERGNFGVGGMRTKLQAAKIATNGGIECVLVNGKKDNALLEAARGKKIGTAFAAAQPRIGARKRWIAYSSKLAGTVTVDEGAKEVLVKKNRSLLASGVIGCSGRFTVGDAVSIAGEDNKEFARGITNYSSSELNKIKGKKTKEIESILGYKYYDELVHRDNLVLL